MMHEDSLKIWATTGHQKGKVCFCLLDLTLSGRFVYPVATAHIQSTSSAFQYRLRTVPFQKSSKMPEVMLGVLRRLALLAEQILDSFLL